MHFIQYPAPTIPKKIEVYLLSSVDVHELGSHRLAVWTLVRACDGQIADDVILTVDPE